MPISSGLINLLHGVGAEIGVWHGDGAKHILSQCPDVKRLYLIDPYRKATEFKQCDLPPQGYKENGFKNAILNAVNNTMFQSEKAYFIFARSVEAARYFPEELDFVYIDANHNYEYVKQDIETWWPKIKKGGILSGHDYTSPNSGVPKAVDEFVSVNNLTLVAKSPDWYVIK